MAKKRTSKTPVPGIVHIRDWDAVFTPEIQQALEKADVPCLAYKKDTDSYYFNITALYQVIDDVNPQAGFIIKNAELYGKVEKDQLSLAIFAGSALVKVVKQPPPFEKVMKVVYEAPTPHPMNRARSPWFPWYFFYGTGPQHLN